MTDLFGMNATGGTGFALSNPPDKTPQAIPQLASSGNDGSATPHKGQDFSEQNSQTTVDAPKEALFTKSAAPADAQTYEPKVIIFSANMVTGPTPTFQVSLMDIGSELRNEIALAQAKHIFIPEPDLATSMPEIQLVSSDSSSISSADLASPTQRRDTTTTVSANDMPAAPDTLSPSQAQHGFSTDIQDPEALYAGIAAMQIRPYDGVDISA